MVLDMHEKQLKKIGSPKKTDNFQVHHEFW